MLQDTHIHIQDIKSRPAIDDLLGQAFSSGFGRIFNCAISPADWPLISDLARKDPRIIPFYGFHPWFADLCDEKTMAQLESILAMPGMLAGEMGLDKARKNVDFRLQQDVFSAQLILAKKFNKPFVVHSVRAWPETMSLIRAHAGGVKFLIHSFNGSVEIAREIEAMGGFFSISVKEFTRPDVTVFKDLFCTLPLNRLLIETDFPYQIKWSSPPEYIAAVRNAYALAADWRGLGIEPFIKAIFDNGTFFTHTTISG